ncbi:hypothetical protein ACOME3_007504 [Neoechinorhynchus agilis]
MYQQNTSLMTYLKRSYTPEEDSVSNSATVTAQLFTSGGVILPMRCEPYDLVYISTGPHFVHWSMLLSTPDHTNPIDLIDGSYWRSTVPEKEAKSDIISVTQKPADLFYVYANTPHWGFVDGYCVLVRYSCSSTEESQIHIDFEAIARSNLACEEKQIKCRVPLYRLVHCLEQCHTRIMGQYYKHIKRVMAYELKQTQCYLDMAAKAGIPVRSSNFNYTDIQIDELVECIDCERELFNAYFKPISAVTLDRFGIKDAVVKWTNKCAAVSLCINCTKRRFGSTLDGLELIFKFDIMQMIHAYGAFYEFEEDDYTGE